MGTRGFVGFKTDTKKSRNGNIFGVYNQFDSYYSYLGEKMLTLYQINTKEMFKKTFDAIKWTEDEECDTCVNPLGLLNGMYSNQEVFNEADFLDEGLDCEYGYLYNLENDTLELYRGFFDFPQYGLDNNRQYHTHHVLTITRKTKPSAIRMLFSEIGKKKYYNMTNVLTDGKYLEQIIMDSLPMGLK